MEREHPTPKTELSDSPDSFHGFTEEEAAGEPKPPSPPSAKKSKKESWYDGCSYRCRFCPKSYGVVQAMVTHLKVHHYQKDAQIKECYEARETSMTCGICGVEVKRNIWSVKIHLSKMHRMSVEEYGKRWEPNCFRCSGCAFSFIVASFSDFKMARRKPTPTPWPRALKCHLCVRRRTPRRRRR